MCQRRKQIDRFTGDLDLLVYGHCAQCAHIVQTVGDFDQNHTHIVRQCEQDFAEVLRLFRGFGVEYARHFGQTVHHCGDLLTKHIGDIFDRVFGIFNHVVQQCRHDRLYAQSDLVDCNFCNGNRV